MNHPIRYESIQEPQDDEERELMDPDNWDWENPIEGVTVREPSVTVRFTRAEYVALWRLASAQGLTTNEVIKQAASKPRSLACRRRRRDSRIALRDGRVLARGTTLTRMPDKT